MQILAVVTGCLACVGRSRRVHHSIERVLISPSRESKEPLRFFDGTETLQSLAGGSGHCKLKYMSTCARLLLELEAATAFAPSSSRSADRWRSAALAEKALAVARAPQLRRMPRISRAAAVQMTEQDLPPPGECQVFTLYSQRWIQLTYLALFALLSDWVCFSVAAEPETFQAVYSRDPATLVDIFFFTNVLFCFLEPTIIRRLGLRKTVVGSGALMALGCLLRSGLPFSATLPPYEQVVAGTVLVGAAQPSFQCTPPLLSGTWFGSTERALATAIAINFNQVGIATAFLVGGSMMGDVEGLHSYFGVITAAAFIVASGAALQFQERPRTPPTSSAAARLAVDSDPEAPSPPSFIVTARQLLKTPGFVQALVAFVGSIAVSNIVSEFVELTLHDAGIWNQETVDIAGAGFQAAIVIGGIVLGGYVDRTREYKQVTLACILGALVLLLPLGLGGMPKPLVIASLLGLGALMGPVQPINAELAVEVAYPADENAIEALQQLCGNLFTAFLVPVAERATEVHLNVANTGASLRGDTALLGVIALGALAYFNTFNARLERTAVDCAMEESE